MRGGAAAEQRRCSCGGHLRRRQVRARPSFPAPSPRPGGRQLPSPSSVPLALRCLSSHGTECGADHTCTTMVYIRLVSNLDVKIAIAHRCRIFGDVHNYTDEQPPKGAMVGGTNFLLGFPWCVDYLLFCRLADKDYVAVKNPSRDNDCVTGWMDLQIFDLLYCRKTMVDSLVPRINQHNLFVQKNGVANYIPKDLGKMMAILFSTMVLSSLQYAEWPLSCGDGSSPSPDLSASPWQSLILLTQPKIMCHIGDASI